MRYFGQDFFKGYFKMLFFSQDEGRYRWNSNKAEGYAKRVRMIMRDAKKVNTKKLIAIFTAISLAFLQAAPVGVAANTPADQLDGSGVHVPVKSATDAPSEPSSAQAVIPPNFLMDTGGISKTEETEIPQNDEIQAVNQALDSDQQDAVSELAQYAQNLTDSAQHTQFEAALSEAAPDAQYRYRIGANGDQSWSWTSADGETTYTLHQDHRMVPIGIDGQMEEEILWSFEALSIVMKTEVEQCRSQLPADSLAYFEEALSQTDDTTVFSRTTIGTDTIYQWNDKSDASKLYTISFHPGPSGTIEAAFSVQIAMMPWGLTHLGPMLTDMAQRTQFETAILDVAPLTRDNFETL
ncbi:MAG TPA: hypothetical protein PKV84_07720, partial [Candidatus Omnitrophota bacterium]|nr:hypothetical protein [Candidatus Omnitrophota bacterium]